MARKEQRAAYLFLSPWLFGLAAFWLIPIGASILLSLSEYQIIVPPEWVGFENYLRFFGESRSITIFWNTLRFAFFAVSGNVLIGLLLALALNRAMPGWLLYFFRLAFFLPVSF